MNFKEINFSLWCDFIERDFLQNRFAKLLESGFVNGATSNPAIFEQAFLNSHIYKNEISSLKCDAKSKYETLAIEDIKLAAKILLPLYEKGDGGFISIEVDPNLCDDSFGTIEEGARLFKAIDMPNVMIKIPATQAGYEAMRELAKMGININATLIFSPEQALLSAKAIKEGKDKSAKKISGVISVFVSRFDRLLDEVLDKKGLFGISNAMACHNLIKDIDKDIKTLFASTGVKGDIYPKDYYITSLLLPNTINTAPLEAIEAFMANDSFNGEVHLLTNEEIGAFFDYATMHGVDIDKTYAKLMQDGLSSFKQSFAKILDNLK